MKKLLILHTGGTFGMVPLQPDQTLAPNQFYERITRYVPEIEKIANIDFRMVFNMDSADMQPHHWQQLATVITREMDNYDGFVIIHGTDSMSYTAAALSFMLRNLPKPVIITGSQRPLAEIRTDARNNLINSVELATYAIPEVCIFFGTCLFRGNRAVKISSTGYQAFDSPNFPPLANVGLDITIYHRHLQPTSDFRLETAISDRVIEVRYFPGLRSDLLHLLYDSPVKVVILKALGLGNVAIVENTLVEEIKRLVDSGRIVVITSQSRHGRVDLSRYQNGKRLAEVGAIGAGDMTTETTIVKMMHLLGVYGDDPDRIQKLVGTSLAGEITDS